MASGSFGVDSDGGLGGSALHRALSCYLCRGMEEIHAEKAVSKTTSADGRLDLHRNGTNAARAFLVSTYDRSIGVCDSYNRSIVSNSVSSCICSSKNLIGPHMSLASGLIVILPHVMRKVDVQSSL